MNALMIHLAKLNQSSSSCSSSSSSSNSMKFRPRTEL
jgi:hypothetical protein